MNIYLLRGLVREKEHWNWFKSYIEDQFPSANIILLEIPGVGETCDQISPDSFKEMVKFMRDKHEDTIKNDEENLLMAMSLGGMIARVWLDIYPEDFKKVILVNTSFKGITPLFKRLRPLSLLRFINIFFTPSIESREKKILAMVSNNKIEREKLIDSWVDIQKKRPVRRKSFINQIKAALTSKVSIEMPKGVELLIIGAKGDGLCHYESSILLNKAWGGELKIHESAGHDLPIDDPNWLVSTMKNWYQK